MVVLALITMSARKYIPRTKLPPLEGTVPRDAYLALPEASAPVCPHATLPLFSAEAVKSGLETELPSGRWLPPHLAETVVKWARVGSVLDLPDATKVPFSLARHRCFLFHPSLLPMQATNVLNVRAAFFEPRLTVPCLRGPSWWAVQGQLKRLELLEAAAAPAEAATPVDPKAKKVDPKGKGAVVIEAPEVPKEVAWDEQGVDLATCKLLPRVFVHPTPALRVSDDALANGASANDDSADSAAASGAGGAGAGEGEEEAVAPEPDEGDAAGFGCVWPPQRVLVRPFMRFWTNDQRRRIELDKTLAASNLPTSYEKALADARRNGVAPPPPPSPEGPFRDELAVGVLKAAAQLAPFMRPAPRGAASRPSTASGGKEADADAPPFLWEAIYPQRADGRPCYNPAGRYVVKVWAAGAWRAVAVDDQVPVNAKGECCLPLTEGRELWPVLLAKAMYAVLAVSPLGESSGAAYSLAAQNLHAEDRQRDDTSAVAAGCVFGLLLQCLTGWHPGTPKSLQCLAANAPPEDSDSDARDNDGDDGLDDDDDDDDDAGALLTAAAAAAATTLVAGSPAREVAPAVNEFDPATGLQAGAGLVNSHAAARALVRALVNDGVPCAPLEQFKYDEIYRATIAQVLGKDPFLESSGRPKWPQPPSMAMRRGGKKAHGVDLLRVVEQAGVSRAARIAEVEGRIFDPVRRTRLFALCGTEAPPKPEPETAAATPARRRSEMGKSVSSALTGATKGAATAAGASLMSGMAGAAAAAALRAQTGELLAEADEDASSVDMETFGDATSLTGSVDVIDEFGNVIVPAAEDEDGEEAEGAEEAEAAAVLSTGSRPGSSSTWAGRGQSRLGSAMMSVRTGVRLMTPKKKEEVLFPATRLCTHVILAVGLRQHVRPSTVGDAKDLGKLAGNGASLVSDRRLGWLRNDKSLLRAAADMDNASVGDSSAASTVAGTPPPEPKLLVLWRSPEAFPDTGSGEAFEMPVFSPDHPAMAKGHLRWITPSAFIASMGGPTQVSLVELTTRNAMALQHAPSPAAAEGPAAPSSLVVLRRHWNGSAPAPAMGPTLLRIITRPDDDEEEDDGKAGGADDDVTAQSRAARRDRTIRLFVSVEADAPAPASGITDDGVLASLFVGCGSPGASGAPGGAAGGALELRAVPFVPPEPTDEDEDEYLEEDGASPSAAAAAAALEAKLADRRQVAWVRDWRRPSSARLALRDGDGASGLGDADSGTNADGGRGCFEPTGPAALAGVYRHRVPGMPDGTVRLQLTSAAPYDAGPTLPCHFACAEVLLPSLPRAGRTEAGRGTVRDAFQRDYFFQVEADLPHGGLLSFACSEQLVVGPAADVWGAALTTAKAPAAAPEAAAVAAAPSVPTDWKHARRAHGGYPALPCTVAPSMQAARDRRGRGDYDLRAENWAVLFRYNVKVMDAGDARKAGVEADAAASATLMDDVMGAASDCGARLKLHLSDPVARKFVRLVTISPAPDGSKATVTHPLLETPPLRWRSEVKQGYVVMGVLEKPPHVSLGPGTWELCCLADHPLTPLASLDGPETPDEAVAAAAAKQAALEKHARLTRGELPLLADVPTERAAWCVPGGPMARCQRWAGTYAPNATLTLLDDVLAGGGSTSTVSLRAEVFPQAKSPVGCYALRLKVYARAKGKTALEALDKYDGLNAPPFSQRSGMELVADVRGLDHLTLELLALPKDGCMLELCLDDRRMDVPPALRSAASFASTIAPLLDSADDPGEERAAAPSSVASGVAWSCPKWRLIVVPSTPHALTLSPDSTYEEWQAKVFDKWVSLRGGSSSMDKVSEAPFWLKANDKWLAERKASDAARRKQYKQHQDRLKKGLKGKKAPGGASSLGAGPGAAASGVRPESPWFGDGLALPMLGPEPLVARVLETGERLLMFSEDDRGAAAKLARQLEAGNRLVEDQERQAKLMQQQTSAVVAAWVAQRQRYRLGQANRRDAADTLRAMGERALGLGEGEKGKAMGLPPTGSGGGGGDPKKKK